MSKYQPLADHLARLKADEWRPTFHELERTLGFELPQAARKPSWWNNEGSGHVTTWTASGWEVDPERVDVEGEHVTFRRVRPVEETRELAPRLDDEEAAEEVFRHEAPVRDVARIAGGGLVAAGLIGLALGLAAMGLRRVFR